MRHEEALELIRGGVEAGGCWADLGAGSGTFTRVLGELIGSEGEVWALDRDADAVRDLRQLEPAGGAALHAARADFTTALTLPPLRGILMANALHFVRDQESVLERIVGNLQPGGRFILVEYDRSGGNRWVPHPIPPARFRVLADAVGLSTPVEIGRRRSGYQGEMYAAVARVRRERRA